MIIYVKGAKQMKLIKNLLMILSLTIFIVIAGITLSAIANILASNMTITAVYIVISILLIIAHRAGRRN